VLNLNNSPVSPIITPISAFSLFLDVESNVFSQWFFRKEAVCFLALAP